MKDKELRNVLDEMGFIEIEMFSGDILRNGEFDRMGILEHKVNLILKHLGQEYKTNNRLEPIKKPAP